MLIHAFTCKYTLIASQLAKNTLQKKKNASYSISSVKMSNSGKQIMQH